MRKLFLKSMLLLCALIVGNSSVWAQSDYSAVYGSGSAFTSVITGFTVTIGSSDYHAVKAGTGKAAGSVTINVPKDTKYLHLHAAAWNGETVSLSITPNTYSSTTSISLTADSNISGNGSTYDIDDDKCTSDYYKVITFTNALATATNITFTATGGKRFVLWGVNAEEESSDPSSEASFTNTTPSIDFPATKTYSQPVTTAEGYTGTITYSMTANTAGATINSSTGLVTVTKGGSVTVKAIASAVSGSFSGSEASYTLTVNDTRTSAGLSWSAATANVTYGADNNVFPTLTNTHNVPVTYSSSNQAAATIDANGVITLKDITADTDISAIFEGNDDYLGQTVTYTLKVKKAPFAIKDGVFDFVEAAAADEDYGSSIQTTTNGQHYDTDDATWTAGNVTMVTSGKYRWWSSNNGCDLRFYSNDPRSSATFSVPDGYAITKIVTTGGNFVTISSGGGLLSGSTWTGASQSVKLSISTSTVNIKTITVTYGSIVPVTISSTSGFATLFSNCALDFSGLGSELKAYTATVSENTVTLTEVNDIPANTGVVLKGTVKTHNVPVAASSSTAKGDLMGNTSAATAYNAYDGYDLYMLALNGEGKAQFTKVTGGSIAAGKAFLKLSSGADARELNVVFADDEPTAIETVKVEKANNEYFNLAGQRVAQPTKGLYIVNGKKVVVK